MPVLQEQKPAMAARLSIEVRSSGSAVACCLAPLPRFDGVIVTRCRLLGANTPWKRVRLTLGSGTNVDLAEYLFLLLKSSEVESIQEQHMKVYIEVKGRTEALNEGHRASAGRRKDQIIGLNLWMSYVCFYLCGVMMKILQYLVHFLFYHR